MRLRETLNAYQSAVALENITYHGGIKMEKIVKIGNVELYESDALKLYQSGRYIVTYSRIYQLFYSAAQKRVYGTEIYYQKGLCKRGRFHTLTGSDINKLVKMKLVKE